MAPRRTRQARVDVDAHAALGRLQRQLGSQRLPSNVDLVDILSALAMYTPPQQAAGMLAAYWEYCQRRAAEQRAGSDEPEEG